MSFILDALKKSESDRQRRDTPGIADVPDSSRGKSAPRWIWALAALLAVNALVLIGLWLRPGADVPGANSGQPTAADKAPGGPGSSFSQLVSEARESRPPPVEQTDVRAPEPSASSRKTAQQSVPDSPPQVAAAAAARSAPLATFDELRAGGKLQLPDLHLDIHVYGDKPADRFVFVNMNKYREQGKLTEGPVVKEISADGVILEHQGMEFLLPRE